jgi:hypothetical protein
MTVTLSISPFFSAVRKRWNEIRLSVGGGKRSGQTYEGLELAYTPKGADDDTISIYACAMPFCLKFCMGSPFVYAIKTTKNNKNDDILAWDFDNCMLWFKLFINAVFGSSA